MIELIVRSSIVASRFAGKTPTDVCYSSDHWLSEWAAAGWLSPLELKYPELNAYTSDYFPYVIEGMTYQGKNYGIPYYADTWAFLYNEDHLKKAGISQPPTTWAELTQQSLQVKSKGIANYPVILLFAQDDPGLTEALARFLRGFVSRKGLVTGLSLREGARYLVSMGDREPVLVPDATVVFTSGSVTVARLGAP